MPRYLQTTAELDEAEHRWWTENGDLEEDFCWVQTPRVQRALRRRYLREVTALVGPASSVLELGCGTGWFSLLLAGMGVSDIVGLDFSSEQIDRARRAAGLSVHDNRVRFEVAGDAAGAIASGRRFDVVVMHAFLHHLAADEVQGALDDAADRLVTGGKLVLVEPLLYPDGPTQEVGALRALRHLEGTWRWLHQRGLRSMSPAERIVRDRLAGRHAGTAPFGPSPKEIPFLPGELEEFLAPRFTIVTRRPCLSMSHMAAQELLIASLSQPRIGRALAAPTLALARVLDTRFLARTVPPSTVWIFQLLVCTKR